MKPTPSQSINHLLQYNIMNQFNITLTSDQLKALQDTLLFVYDVGLPDSIDDNQQGFDQVFDKVMDADSWIYLR